MFKLSGRTEPLYPKYSILPELEVIRRLGFDGVEICLEVEELTPGSLSRDQAMEIHRQVVQTGLNPHTVGSHKDYIYDDNLYKQTKTADQLTKTMGSDKFIFAGLRPKTGDEDPWKRMLARTRTLVRLAEDVGVIIAIEFEPGFIVGSIHRLRGKIAHGHIENMRADVNDYLLPHEGGMDLPALLSARRHTDFSIALALDLYKYDYEAVASAAIETIKTYL